MIILRQLSLWKMYFQMDSGDKNENEDEQSETAPWKGNL